jgi:starch phosphorylase
VGDRAPEIAFDVKFGGRTERTHRRARAAIACAGFPSRVVKGVAYDTPILGYRVGTNLLRLWKAEASSRSTSTRSTSATTTARSSRRSLGDDHEGALSERRALAGKQLRLEQQYFFVSCSLQDMIRIHAARRKPPASLPRVLGPCSSTTRIRRSPSPS